jgi:peroxiredoxin
MLSTSILGFALLAAVQVGQEAPDFELSDSKGNTYKLSSYRGEKPVVLEFFRSGDW